MAEKKIEFTDLVLVTGASGYIAGHIIKLLLKQGYNVRGTLRSLQNAETKYKYLYDLKPKNQSNKFELVEANLNSNDKWDEAIDGCQYIFSVASPVLKYNEKITSKELIETAVGGIKRILSVCLKYKNNIKRFIFTSSVAAMYFTNEHQYQSAVNINRNDWSDIKNNKDIGAAYMTSKTLSEQYLWDFIKKHNDPFQCVSLNPSFVIGPILSKTKPSSVDIIRGLLNNDIIDQMPFLPNCNLPYVDVRDVALCHVNAMTADAHVVNMNRYLVSNHGLWSKDIAVILTEKYGGKGYYIPMFVQYDFVWKIIGQFNRSVKEFFVPFLSKVIIIDNQQTIKDLNIQFTPLDKSIVDCAESLIEFGWIAKPRLINRQIITIFLRGSFISFLVYLLISHFFT